MTRLLPVFKNGDVGSRRGYLVKQGCVDVQRKYARKVYNNAGGATVKTVISGLELIMKHIIPSKRIPMCNRPVLSVFHNKFFGLIVYRLV